MIFGASSFAGPLADLKGHVGSIELYIPKMGIYNDSVLEKEKLDRILDEVSIYDFASTVHAPYSAADSKYPSALQVDTARMGKREFALMGESVALANHVGAKIVVLHPGRVGPDREKSFLSMVKNLCTLSSVAEDYGVTLALENKEGTDPSNFCCEAEELFRTIETVNSGYLKATFDIGHANLTCGGDPEKLGNFVRTLHNHIIHLHLHDNSGQWTDKYDGDEHMAPGKGCADFSVLKLLSGYRGVYNLEVFSLEDLLFGKKALQSAFGL
ncbi:sugar phosphate isomerase/epimerase family protein [Methanosarcina sp. Z-7115]|uniref:Sugar phosphate isomerase/epimerase family protein n=1 Tax=Methanosarcina baikalica TaxID=3073890 RepID=A0ABU2CXS7_9EURY|nr:sugar phosphate isomerase/epimerase family protein [Methanosarcina sp. Z-7115]MDR7664536.1 sugar phosphate isomerase/epimerase family protein [Methanosarcina sp. Z-7115]